MTDLNKIADEKIKAQLTDLLAKPIDIEINGKLIPIYPLSIHHSDLLADMEAAEKTEDKKLKMQLLVKMVFATLSDSFPDASEKDFGKIPISTMGPIMKAVAKVNGMGEADQKNLKGGFRQKPQ